MATKKIKIDISNDRQKILFTTWVKNDKKNLQELDIKKTEDFKNNSELSGSKILTILEYEKDIDSYQLKNGFKDELKKLDSEEKNKLNQIYNFFKELILNINSILTEKS